MFDLQSYIKEKQHKINDLLDYLLDGSLNPSRILQAMRYSVTAGGKRLRPILCIAAAESIGPVKEPVFNAACALEMIHTYSLIHDDLPAMDDDDLRRGMPTCHIAFDEATAVLAGDALLTLAFQILSSPAQINQHDASVWLRIIYLISISAGYQGMIDGQMKDIASEGKILTRVELEEMHRLKTGRLIEAAVIAGALLNQGTDSQMDSLKSYAGNIGLAFQIADDILNIKGDPVVMGKETGTDNHRQKNTYPSLLGLEESDDLMKTLVNNALKVLEDFDKKADPLRGIATYIITRDK